MRSNQAATLAGVITILVVLNACSDTPLEPTADPQLSRAWVEHETEFVDFNNTVFNPCTNENVTISGRVHIVRQFVAPASDASNLWVGMANFQNVTGTGESGQYQYRVVGRSELGTNVTHKFALDAANATTFVFRQRWIAKGPSADRWFRLRSHQTRTANGDWVLQDFDFEDGCI